MTSENASLPRWSGDSRTMEPLMCQLSIGHYLLQCGVSGANYWLHNETIIDCFAARRALRLRWNPDQSPGSPPNADDFVDRIEQTPEGEVIHWRAGAASALQTISPRGRDTPARPKRSIPIRSSMRTRTPSAA